VVTKIHEEEIRIPIDSEFIEGTLSLRNKGQAIVIFAHGSGSSRFSKRNKYVAEVLSSAGVDTLLFDLLTKEEDAVYENRFDIKLLTERLKMATRWVREDPRTKTFRIGYFGASTGAAAALWAAAELGDEIAAIVSRGGRPDLAKPHISRVKAPTLLIVGGLDDVVIELNKMAYALLTGEKDLVIIPGASHLFEEAGKLDEVARFAADWFRKYLQPAPK
jgi:putative phosphoribosyl transferase